MENGNSYIELRALPPTAQQTRRKQLPPVPWFTEDEEDHQEPQLPPQNPQDSTLRAQFRALRPILLSQNLAKAMRRAVHLMLFCYVLDLILLCPITYDYYAQVISKTEIQGALEFMSANLKADPIMDLQIIGKVSACPAGFEPLGLSVWPGTVAGCLCDSGYLSDLTCKNLESEGCQKDIPLTKSLEIEEWDGMIWCGKKAVLGNDYIKKAECPTGYKECYNGGCFKGDCPITKVEMDSNGALKFTKTQGELPLINIQTSSHDIPCFNKDFSAKSNSSYKLSYGAGLANKGCDKYGFDSQYSTKLYSQSLFDSYTQDSFTSTTMNLPYFEKYSKETMSVLSWRVRMKTAKNDYCLDLDQNMAKVSTTAFSATFMPGKIVAVLVIPHLIILLSLGICRFYLGKAQFLRSFESIIQLTIFACFPVVLTPWPSLIFYRAEYYSELRMTEKYFAEYDLLGCFGESQGGLVIRDLLWMLAKGETNYYILLGLFLSSFSALLVCWWHFWMTKRRNASVHAYLLNNPRN